MTHKHWLFLVLLVAAAVPALALPRAVHPNKVPPLVPSAAPTGRGDEPTP
jgi:hypothetical protein